MNPYRGNHFFEFFYTLFTRSGPLASDEIQMLVLSGVAIAAALVGSFLILRRMTMLANSLSHTILVGIIIAYLVSGMGLPAMLLAAVITGLVTAYLTEFLHKTARLQEDAANGLVFSTLFALGVVLATLFTRNSHIGIEIIMGNADALHLEDLKLTALILFANLILFILFFRPYRLTTFDPGLARSMGVSTTFFNYLLMTQVATTTVGGFRAVGVLMVLAFIVGPPLIARRLTDNLKTMLVLAALIGAIASIIGVAIARHILSVHDIALSTGGIVVCVIVAFYVGVVSLTEWRRLVQAEG